MALPPKGDPRRPMFLAARSMRLLGIVFLLVATCAVLPFMMSGLSGVGRMSYLFIGVAMIYMIPGLCYFILPIFFLQRRNWAVVASIVVASLHELLALIILVVMVVALTGSSERLAAKLIPFSLVILLIAALAQLIWHLSRSFESIRNLPANERGFEPVFPVQAIAPEQGTGETPSQQ